MDALGEALLEHLRLQAALEQPLRRHLEDAIEVHLGVLDEPVPLQLLSKAGASNMRFGSLGSSVSKRARGLADFGQGQLRAPELALVAQAVLADELELAVDALLLEGAARRLRRLGVVAEEAGLGHGLCCR